MLKDSDGFALIESMTAIAIATLCVSAVIAILANASQAVQDAEETLRRTVAGRAIVARLELDLPVGPDGFEGRLDDGTQFRITPGHVDVPWAGAALKLRTVSVIVGGRSNPPIVFTVFRGSR